MPTPPDLYVDSILGCSAELIELKQAMPKGATAHFRGDYVGVGPSPIQTIDFLIEWSHEPHSVAHFYRGKDDHLMLIALGLISESAFEQLWWTNPYSGLIHVIDAYGVDGAKFLQSEKPDRQELIEQVDRAGHLGFWKTVAAASSLRPGFFSVAHDSCCAYGGALNAYAADGTLFHSIPAKENWFEKWFEPRLQQRLTRLIGPGDIYCE